MKFRFSICKAALGIALGFVLALGSAAQTATKPSRKEARPARPGAPLAAAEAHAGEALELEWLRSVREMEALETELGAASLWQKEAGTRAEKRAREEYQRVRETERRDAGRERMERENELYLDGQEAMDESEWDRAAEHFAECAAMKGKRADGALYWQAFALHKLGRKAESLLTLQRLYTEYAQSRWLKDAKALEAEVRQSSGQPVSPEAAGDEELKLLALNACLHSDPERCVPLLEKVLQSGSSPKLKERALFILAQSRSAQAREAISRVARGQGNPDLQRRALRYLGLHGDEESRRILAEVYSSTADTEVKRTILRSFLTPGDKERLLAAARSEKDAELRGEAVRQLGITGARAELWQLFLNEPSVEVRGQILNALFLSGDVARMSELARAEKDPGLRRKAIRNLGIMGGRRMDAGSTLVSIYETDKDEQIRREVINALFLQQNARALVELARKETNPEMKKSIVSKLALLRSKEASDYLLEILNR